MGQSGLPNRQRLGSACGATVITPKLLILQQSDKNAYLSSDGCASGNVDNSLRDRLVVGVDATVADDVVGGYVGDGLQSVSAFLSHIILRKRVRLTPS